MRKPLYLSNAAIGLAVLMILIGTALIVWSVNTLLQLSA